MVKAGLFQSGDKIGAGRYTLLKPLGQGGMGEVWLARDERLGGDVALKFLPAEIRNDAAALDDLRRETARSQKLTHPNIVRIHDLHEDPGGLAFIAMEYVDGPTLSALRVEQPDRVLRWEFLRPLVEQLCSALEYAHGEGVIHRDLKPANLMVDAKGRLKLADFGIAATVSDSASRISGRHGTSGTWPYMSPQQLSGGSPQMTDDIYSLGATLYELLASKPPFHTGDITHQILNEPPEPIDKRLVALKIANEIPNEVAATIASCLAKDAARRPQNAKTVTDRIGSRPVDALSRGNDKVHRLKADLRLPVARFQILFCRSKPFVLRAAGMAALPLLILCWLFQTRHQATEQRVTKRESLAASEADPTNAAFQNSSRLQRWTNSLGMIFVPVPKTKVLFSIWETRRSDFETFVKVTGYDATRDMISAHKEGWKRYGDNWMKPGFEQTPGHPVCGVSWEDAQAFCRWLSETERRVYRLPGDLEWSLAAGLENETGALPGNRNNQVPGLFSWGRQWPPPSGAGNFAGTEANDGDWPNRRAVIAAYRDDFARTAPVGSFAPNQLGIYDLSGNVWEWCEDWLGSGQQLRVLRGGS